MEFVNTTRTFDFKSQMCENLVDKNFQKKKIQKKFFFFEKFLKKIFLDLDLGALTLETLERDRSTENSMNNEKVVKIPYERPCYRLSNDMFTMFILFLVLFVRLFKKST